MKAYYPKTVGKKPPLGGKILVGIGLVLIIFSFLVLFAHFLRYEKEG